MWEELVGQVGHHDQLLSANHAYLKTLYIDMALEGCLRVRTHYCPVTFSMVWYGILEFNVPLDFFKVSAARIHVIISTNRFLSLGSIRKHKQPISIERFQIGVVSR